MGPNFSGNRQISMRPTWPRRRMGPWAIQQFTTISSFLVWFNFAPFATTLMGELGLSAAQVKSLFIANVALTVPARIVIGALVDRFGPRRVFSALLATMSLPCFAFALADSYWQLVVCRLVLSGIGAGFVVGIRMVGEWFPREEIGLAEGIYGGWGNFGSAAGAFALPVLAAGATVLVGQAHGWRVAVALTGLMSLIWSFVYLRMIDPETPSGKPHRATSSGVGLNVFSVGDALAHVAMVAPLYLSVGLLVKQPELKHCAVVLEKIGVNSRENDEVEVSITPVTVEPPRQFAPAHLLRECPG